MPPDATPMQRLAEAAAFLEPPLAAAQDQALLEAQVARLLETSIIRFRDAEERKKEERKKNERMKEEEGWGEQAAVEGLSMIRVTTSYAPVRFPF